MVAALLRRAAINLRTALDVEDNKDDNSEYSDSAEDKKDE